MAKSLKSLRTKTKSFPHPFGVVGAIATILIPKCNFRNCTRV